MRVSGDTMPIVFLRNKHQYDHIIGFDLTENRVVKNQVSDVEDCGDFIIMEDGRLVGFLNASIVDKSLNQFLFFIDKKIFNFRNKNLSSSVKYLNQFEGNFTLKINDREVENIIYSRRLNIDFGGGLVGNWEAEEERDIFMNIHEVITNVQKV